MPIDNKPLGQIEMADFEDLISNQVAEKRTLDYKGTLPGKADSDKKEFLRDISSFANTAGGHLIYGMTEREGIPCAMPGVELENPDAERSRLENLLRDGIRPRISGVDFKFVQTGSGSFVIVVRIPTSWAKPHMVTLNDGKFHARNSNGKYQMDIDELRSAFLSGYAVKERIERFRHQRLEVMQHPILRNRPNLVPLCLLHAVPFNLDDHSKMVDLSALENLPEFRAAASGVDARLKYSLEGLMAEGGDATDRLTVFRDGGANESVRRVPLTSQAGSNIRSIIEMELERQIQMSFECVLQLQQAIGVAPPLAIMLSLVGAKELNLNISHMSTRWGHGHPIEIDPVELPNICIDQYGGDPYQVLRPLFDGVWLAAGWPRSMNFDEFGARKLWHEQDR